MQAKEQPLQKDEALEQVRVNLLRFLERNKHISLAVMAAHTGYSYDTLKHYRNGDSMTVPVATTLIASYPEIGEGLVCRHCGHMVFSYR